MVQDAEKISAHFIYIARCVYIYICICMYIYIYIRAQTPETRYIKWGRGVFLTYIKSGMTYDIRVYNQGDFPIW